MTKKSLVKTTGVAVLAIAAVIAGRASTKFGAALSLYISTVSGGCSQIKTSGAAFFSTIGSVQAALNSSGTSTRNRKIWATNTCSTAPSKAVYFKK